MDNKAIDRGIQKAKEDMEEAHLGVTRIACEVVIGVLEAIKEKFHDLDEEYPPDETFDKDKGICQKCGKLLIWNGKADPIVEVYNKWVRNQAVSVDYHEWFQDMWDAIKQYNEDR